MVIVPSMQRGIGGGLPVSIFSSESDISRTPELDDAAKFLFQSVDAINANKYTNVNHASYLLSLHGVLTL